MYVLYWAAGIPFVFFNEDRKRKWNSRLLVAVETGKFFRQPKGRRYGDDR